MTTALDATRRALAERLERPRYEVLPLAGIVEEVVAHVPVSARVTVTASPAKGLDSTVETAERAGKIWRDTLEAYEEPPIDDAVRSQLQEFVSRRREELGDCGPTA